MVYTVDITGILLLPVCIMPAVVLYRTICQNTVQVDIQKAIADRVVGSMN